MHTHERLALLPASAFLDPSLFATDYDSWPANMSRDQEQREYVRELTPDVDYFFVNANGTWGAKLLGGMLTTYEVIGYHACTSALLAAILASGRPVSIHRAIAGEIITVQIK